jgi:hypothetical protein
MNLPHEWSTTRQHPPKAPLAFRVGIVGHRPNRLQHADLERLRQVLAEVLLIVKSEVTQVATTHSDLFDGKPAVLRGVSSLAEGVDRLFAEQALRVGFQLVSILPFAQEEYERDFSEGVAPEADSVLRLRELLAKSSTCLELDGLRNDAAQAYGVAGVTLLLQCDLLVVVWDGEKLGRTGGTEQMIEAAKSIALPSVLVRAQQPHTWQFIAESGGVPTEEPLQRNHPDSSHEDHLRRAIQTILLPPRSHSMTSNTEAAEAGRKHARLHDQLLGLRSFYDEQLIRAPASVVRENLDAYQFCTDHLAVRYASRYRCVYVISFLLAAFAVGMALLPQGLRAEKHHLLETGCIAAELAAILLVIGLVVLGRQGRWHERWLDYRLAAELIRHLRIVLPFGGGPPIPNLPAHWATYGQPGSTWMAWYAKAIERAAGCQSFRVDRSYLENCLRHLARLVEEQSRYHANTAKKSEGVERWLHGGALFFLVLTLAACGAHLLPNIWHEFQPPEWIPPLLTFACGFFPALGAALAGINNQGEFRRIAKRSEAMHEHLERLHSEIVGLEERQRRNPIPAEPYLIPASRLARQAADLLLDEVIDRRVVLLDRPVLPPS